MINKICIFIVLLSFLYSSKAQNLVPNWSFEDTLHCPNYNPYIGITQCVKDWYNARLASYQYNDYYNSCAPLPGNNVPGGISHFQYAKNGAAYIHDFLWGKIPDNKQYPQVKLLDSLMAGKWYCGGFYICKRELGRYAVRNAGMHFSKSAIMNTNATPFYSCIPQIKYTDTAFLTDTVNWLLVSGSFQAQGGEQYLTLGNFDTDVNTDTLQVDTSGLSGSHFYAVYLFDAVFLYDCSEHVQAYAGEDASVCGEETAQLGTSPIDRCNYKWTPSAGLDNDTLANPTAKPTQTTTYCLTMTDPYYQVTTDTVVVKVTDDCKQVFFIPNIFSPNGDGQNDIFRIRGENINDATLQIYNRWGNLVFESQDVTQGWDGTFNGKDCEEGAYYFKAEIIFKDGRVENKKGNLTLVK